MCSLSGRTLVRTLPTMFRRLTRAVRTSTAAVVIASFVAWHPAMMGSMATMSCGMEHGAHRPNERQHHAIPINCCTACACSVVASPALTTTIALQASNEYAPAPDWAGIIAVAPSHRLPLSIGPPLHLV